MVTRIPLHLPTLIFPHAWALNPEAIQKREPLAKKERKKKKKKQAGASQI